MKAVDFVVEFEPAHFPPSHGPWIGIDAHDPPFTLTQLRQMAKQGVIELEAGATKANARYRLTPKATQLSQRAAEKKPA